jgi:bacillithiol biosynthesis deacetylase BshB1
MAFGPHPDDIELGCAGSLIKMRKAGRSVVLVDLVEGELSTRGTVEQRRREALEASRIIGAHVRENLGLADGNLQNTPEARDRAIEVLRTYRPNLVLLPYPRDRHPDHEHAARLLYDAVFASGLDRVVTRGSPWRPARLAYYLLWDERTPDYVVDITEEYEDRTRAVDAYRSQFTTDDPGYAPTRLTSAEFAWRRESRMGYYGSLIGAKYGEPFVVRGTLEMGTPLDARYTTF